MKILVTGGAGFIGSHVVDAYVGLGHDVTVVDNFSTGKESNLNPKARLVRADIRDRTAVEQLFREGKFDVVNHHAAQMDVRRSVADPVEDASINILGVLTLLEACRAHAVRKCIFSSTGGAIYGEQDFFPADESHPTRPISPYGVAKLGTEQYLFYYRVVHGIDYVVLRYANVYGPRQNPEGEAGVVAIFVSRMLSGVQPVINGDGRQTRDYVYVGDVVKANTLALTLSGSDTFNVGTGIESDVNTIFGLARSLVHSSCAEEHAPPKQGEQQRSVLSYAKIQKLLGWSPAVMLNEGLEKTVEYFRNLHGHGNTDRHRS